MDSAISKNELARLKELFRGLLSILESEGYMETYYARHELHKNILMIEDALNRDIAPTELHELFTGIKESYKSMYPPRGGLTEFFIWREDFDERVKANQPLENLKNGLDEIINPSAPQY